MGTLSAGDARRNADFERAAREFRALAEGIAADAWDRPRQAGKWTPAQELEHIVLSHELFLSQLGGGPAMHPIVTGWRLIPLRALVLPWILGTGRFPRARAPRESRPVAPGLPRNVLLARLETATRGILEFVGDAERMEGARPLRHPYFGMMSVRRLVRLSAVHTRHHAANLPRSGPAGRQ